MKAPMYHDVSVCMEGQIRDFLHEIGGDDK